MREVEIFFVRARLQTTVMFKIVDLTNCVSLYQYYNKFGPGSSLQNNQQYFNAVYLSFAGVFFEGK